MNESAISHLTNETTGDITLDKEYLICKYNMVQIYKIYKYQLVMQHRISTSTHLIDDQSKKFVSLVHINTLFCFIFSLTIQ